jgi:hypothetical protein
MLEFDTDTIAFTTAALEQSSQQLARDSRGSEVYRRCARQGGRSLTAMTQVAHAAVEELNAGKKRTGNTWWHVRRHSFATYVDRQDPACGATARLGAPDHPIQWPSLESNWCPDKVRFRMFCKPFF